MNYLLTPYSQNCYIFKGSLGTFISGDKEVAYIGYWTSPTFSSYLFVLTECLSAVLAFVYVLQYILCFCVSLAILSALIRGCCDFNLFIFGLVAAWWMCFHVPNLWMSADLLMSDPVIVRHEWNRWRKSFTTSTTSVLVWTNARSVSSVLSRAGGVKRNVNGCDLVRFPLTQAFIQRENGRKKHRLSKSCSCINLYIQKDQNITMNSLCLDLIAVILLVVDIIQSSNQLFERPGKYVQMSSRANKQHKDVFAEESKVSHRLPRRIKTDVHG